MKKPSISGIHGRFLSMILLSVWMMCLTITAHAQTITLNQTDVPLENVLKSITSQAGYKFVYTGSVIDTKQKVSVNVRSNDIKVILDAVFKGTKITFTIADKQVALSLRKEVTAPQTNTGTRTVSGKVTEKDGSPLIGVLVTAEGSPATAFTGMTGEYCISVKDDPQTKLTFKYLGMTSTTLPIGALSQLNVSMLADNVLLDQVVVTGYQTISKERSAGSYSIVKGAEFQDKAISRGSVLESLEGVVSGLRVNLGSEGDKFLIRGITSINSNRKPLFIVDGVSVPSEMIERIFNGNDINNVTVLKDATAASIWGAQAANGVVVITTKSGSRTDRTEVTYNGSYTFRGMPDYSYNDIMNSSLFIKNATEIFDPVGYQWSAMSTGIDNVVLPHEIPLYKHYLGEISLSERDAQLKKLSELDGRKDYEKYFMSNSWLTNHSVSLSGGGNNQTFYVSLGYQGQQSNSKALTNEYRINARENINITKWMNLDLTLNASYRTDKSNMNQFSLDGIAGAVGLTSLPYAVFYDENGNPLSFTKYLLNESVKIDAQNKSRINLDYYPITDFNNTTQEYISSNIRANAGLRIKLLKGLNYEGRFSYYISNGKRETYTPSESYNVRLDRVYATSTNGTAYLPSTGGYFRTYSALEDSYTVRNQLSYDNSFKGGLHQITALLGQEINHTKSGNNTTSMRGYDKQTMSSIFFNDYSISVTGVPDPILKKMNSATNNMFSSNRYSQGETTYRFVSFYSNAAYTYNNRYSINASIRVDQSNLFGSDPSVQFKPIWAIGGMWNMKRENFMKNISWVNDLQIRTSYGFAGNSPSPGQGGPYNIINSTSSPTFSEFGLGYVISTPANNKLTWEKTRTWNIGATFSLFKNRLSGSFDLYDKKTTDLLASSPVDPSTGYTSVFQNIGVMTNKGVELSLNNRNLSLRNFVWDTGLSLSYNKNNIAEMYFTPPSSPSGYVGRQYFEGYPASALFAYHWAGLDPTDGAARAYNSKNEIVRNIVDIDDISALSYMGTTVPPWSVSITNNLRYKNFELSFMLIANLGHKMRNDSYMQTDFRFTSTIHNDFDKRWRKPGDENVTNIPSFYKKSEASFRDGGYTFLRYSDIGILDASYIKFRDISVGYFLPENICKKIGTKSIKLRVQASNLLTIGFNKEGIDPEAFSLRGGSRYDRYKASVSASLLIEF